MQLYSNFLVLSLTILWAPPALALDMPCQSFYHMDEGLTERAWRLVSNIPLSQLSSADLKDLKRVTTACYLSRGPDAPHGFAERNALRRVQDSLDKLQQVASSRAQAERLNQNRKAELEAEASKQREVLQEIDAVARRLSTRPLDEPCSPTPREVEIKIVSSVDSVFFRQNIQNSSSWTEFSAECDRRDTRAFEARNNQEAERLAAIRADRLQAATDYVTRSLAKHQTEISRLGIPSAISNSRFVLELNPLLSSVILLGYDTTGLTLSNWVAMILESKGQSAVTSSRDPTTGDWGFSLKQAGERSDTYFVHLDGGELFVSAVQVGNMLYRLQNQQDRFAVGNQLVGISGLADAISGNTSPNRR